jgi:hypothetical protein
MEKPTSEKRWRLEVNNPKTKTDWQALWGFDEDQHATFQELIEELNRINAPVQLRIIRNSQ